ncbi:MAG TPA: sialidase family protein, partial [Ignavibacteria bacterium]
MHIAWEDNRNANYDIYYKRSSDGGISWGADVRMTNNNSSYSASASITVSGSVVHVVWYDNRDGNQEIYYKRSTDAGISWGADVRLTNNTGASYFPSVAVSGSVVHVVWIDGRDGNNEIYCKRSTDAGLSWGADTRLTNNTAYSFYPSIAVSGSVVHVVWEDYRDGNYEIYYKSSLDEGVSWGTDTRLTNNTAGSYFPSVAVSGS